TPSPCRGPVAPPRESYSCSQRATPLASPCRRAARRRDEHEPRGLRRGDERPEDPRTREELRNVGGERPRRRAGDGLVPSGERVLGGDLPLLLFVHGIVTHSPTLVVLELVGDGLVQLGLPVVGAVFRPYGAEGEVGLVGGRGDPQGRVRGGPARREHGPTPA